MRRLRIHLSESGEVTRNIENFDVKEIDTQEVLIKVAYSSLNYKDALSASGNKGISRFYPHTPGIDASGTVEHSSSPKYKIGDKVIVTGYDLGMNTNGGFSEYISVPAQWITPLPKGLSLKEAMCIGTAGLTAAMCIDKILTHSNSLTHPILVTGASGGVGSIALSILKKLDIPTVALTRKLNAHEFIFSAGADQIISSLDQSNKPLLKPIYSAAIDTLGGDILTSVLKQISPYGHVSICGMAQSANLTTSVFPFILRGITMHGIDSAEAPQEWRIKLWDKLATNWKPNNLESICRCISLEQLDYEINLMLLGNAKGRVVINMNT